jgi:hypothetical protein
MSCQEVSCRWPGTASSGQSSAEEGLPYCVFEEFSVARRFLTFRRHGQRDDVLGKGTGVNSDMAKHSKMDRAFSRF